MAFTQLTSFGTHVCPRYGSFAGKRKASPAFPSKRQIELPPQLIDELRLQRIDEDDILLIIAAQISIGQLH